MNRLYETLEHQVCTGNQLNTLLKLNYNRFLKNLAHYGAPNETSKQEVSSGTIMLNGKALKVNLSEKHKKFIFSLSQLLVKKRFRSIIQERKKKLIETPF